VVNVWYRGLGKNQEEIDKILASLEEAEKESKEDAEEEVEEEVEEVSEESKDE